VLPKIERKIETMDTHTHTLATEIRNSTPTPELFALEQEFYSTSAPKEKPKHPKNYKQTWTVLIIT